MTKMSINIIWKIEEKPKLKNFTVRVVMTNNNTALNLTFLRKGFNIQSRYNGTKLSKLSFEKRDKTR